MTAQSLVADPGAIEQIAAAIQSGKTDPVAVVEASLRRIAAVEKDVQGWSLLDRQRALADAQTLRREAQAGRIRSPLHGIPVAVKDVLDVAGLPTRAGSKTRAGIAPSTIDAHVVTLLKAAGAVVLGKAHTTEFAYFDGPPPTRNPHNVAHTPGGSSAGPAAVVASGMVPLSLGTQTAGSVSRPAAYCGIAAFKPSTLAWSSSGLVPFAPSFDTIGVFAHRVRDAVAAARVLMPAFLRQSADAPSAPTIGIVEDPITETASAAVAGSIRAAAEALVAADVKVKRFKSPVPFAEISGWHKTIIEYEVARAHPYLEHNPDVNAGLREAVARGRVINDAAYLDAHAALGAARERFWLAAAEAKALLFPAAPDVAPVGMTTGDPRFIVPFKALGGPIASIPVGTGTGGMPLGLMLIGAPGTDAKISFIAEQIAPVIELPR
ncbi:MAG TPA: amidase [Candidatus Cybelea sp.]|nr:amidase [Candidatus Cybelea sp.]